jgi:hypothetical protein
MSLRLTHVLTAGVPPSRAETTGKRSRARVKASFTISAHIWCGWISRLDSTIVLARICWPDHTHSSIKFLFSSAHRARSLLLPPTVACSVIPASTISLSFTSITRLQRASDVCPSPSRCERCPSLCSTHSHDLLCVSVSFHFLIYSLCLTPEAGSQIRGSTASFVKNGVDPQEEQLRRSPPLSLSDSMFGTGKYLLFSSLG